MLKSYETIFILTPVLTEEQMKDAVMKFEQVLKENGAEIVFSDSWGLKKMAYPIQKKSTGFYHEFEFKAEPSLIAKLETEFKRDERVLRFLTTVLDKYSLEYNVNRRAGKYRKVKPATDGDATTPSTPAPTPIQTVEEV